MSEKWDGKVVMSTPGGPIVEMSLGDLLARKDAEIARLRENVDRAGKEAERADRLRAEIARVKADERKNRAEIKRLREAATSAGAALAAAIELLERGREDAPSKRMFSQMLADYRVIVARTRKALEGKP